MGKRGPKPMTAEMRVQRFWSRVKKTDTCWIWTGTKNDRGYGMFNYPYRKAIYTHRLSYELANGPIPTGLEVDHRCHVPLCVNPEHLRLVTRKQNNEHHSGANRNSKSGVRGVFPASSSGREYWVVQVTHNRVTYSGGCFPLDQLDEAEAASIRLRNQLHTHNDLDRMSNA